MKDNPSDLRYLLMEAWQPTSGYQTLLELLVSTADQLGSLFPKLYYGEDRRGRSRMVPFTLDSLPNVVRTWDATRVNRLQLFLDDDASECLTTIRFSDMGGIRVTHAYTVNVAEKLCLAEPAWLDRMDRLSQGVIEIGSPLAVTLSTYFDRMDFRDGKQPLEWVLPAPDYTRLYWRNYWSPLMLQWLGGEDKVSDQPWHSVSRLPGGWLKLDIAPSPFEWNKPEYLSLRDQITANLRLPEVNVRINVAMDEHGKKTWPNLVKAPI